ncbi:MAG TPA: hypothetical protein VEJ87_08310 [Acidimicrobiales bacterium]|nr:hypothetical protein [Acidimicrobiales bacterium]
MTGAEAAAVPTIPEAPKSPGPPDHAQSKDEYARGGSWPKATY